MSKFLKIITASLLVSVLFTPTVHAATTPPTTASRLAALERRLAALEKTITSLTGKLAKTHEELMIDAVNKNLPSVVSIIATKDIASIQFINGRLSQSTTERTQVGAGTGFIVTANGYIATNRHVVSNKTLDYTVILNSGEKLPAAVVYTDAEYDVALLKVTSKTSLPPVTIGESKSLKLGQTSIAIGNALGLFDNTISTGIISGLKRNIQASDGNGKTENLKDVLQTDAAINPGNSGGPLVNIRGEVIGINVATAIGSQNISFALPIDVVKRILDNLPLF